MSYCMDGEIARVISPLIDTVILNLKLWFILLLSDEILIFPYLTQFPCRKFMVPPFCCSGAPDPVWLGLPLLVQVEDRNLMGVLVWLSLKSLGCDGWLVQVCWPGGGLSLESLFWTRPITWLTDPHVLFTTVIYLYIFCHISLLSVRILISTRAIHFHHILLSRWLWINIKTASNLKILWMVYDLWIDLLVYE